MKSCFLIQFTASSILAMLSLLVVLLFTAAQGEARLQPETLGCRSDADCTLGRVALNKNMNNQTKHYNSFSNSNIIRSY